MKVNNKNKKKLIRVFWMTAATTFLVASIGVVGIIAVCKPGMQQENETQQVVVGEKDLFIQKEPLPEKLEKNIAVFGIDKDELLTDVIFVANLNSEENQIDILSLPRDTKIAWDDALRAELSSIRNNVPPSLSNRWVCKLNEVASKGGFDERSIEDNIEDLTLFEIEKMLGVPIDHYIVINLEIFKKIVDLIGGVEVDVPQRMYYVDRAQDLYIDLQPGLQVLDGEHAEMFVRFRRYTNGDVDRIKAQQVFLEAFAKKITSPQMIFKIPGLVSTIFSDVSTNMKLQDVGEYLPYLKGFNPNNIAFYTLPGVGDMENGRSYFFPDTEAADALIASIFLEAGVDGQAATQTVEEPISVSIFNGNGISGDATRLKEALENMGYRVMQTANYDHFDVTRTKIVMKDQCDTRLLEQYFTSPIIEQDETIDMDVQIIIGSDYR
ncbi:MAG: LCP family protein [Cellulosilyticaceae bacterium]